VLILRTVKCVNHLLSYYLNSLTLIALYGLALSSIKIGLSANGWLSNRVQRVLKHIVAVCSAIDINKHVQN
jgi:hypothetical protein